MRSFIEKAMSGLENKTILDVGAGKGGISLAFAGCSTRVIGIDISKSNSRYAAARSRETNRGLAFSAMTGTAEQLPFRTATFDLLLVNGVLEWIGLDSEDPRVAQEEAIKEFSRVLRDDGWLYLTTENRLFPAFLLVDPHTHLPLVNFLPRRLSRGLTRAVSGRAFGNYIYSKKGLSELLGRVFGRIEFFLPMPHYHTPLSYVRLRSRNQISRESKTLSKNPGLSLKLRLTLAYDSACAQLGLSRIAVPYFAILAKKR